MLCCEPLAPRARANAPRRPASAPPRKVRVERRVRALDQSLEFSVFPLCVCHGLRLQFFGRTIEVNE